MSNESDYPPFDEMDGEEKRVALLAAGAEPALLEALSAFVDEMPWQLMDIATAHKEGRHYDFDLRSHHAAQTTTIERLREHGYACAATEREDFQIVHDLDIRGYGDEPQPPTTPGVFHLSMYMGSMLTQKIPVIRIEAPKKKVAE